MIADAELVLFEVFHASSLFSPYYLTSVPGDFGRSIIIGIFFKLPKVVGIYIWKDPTSKFDKNNSNYRQIYIFF